nr:uncharacterized protein A4U43_C02F80 [Ipomoea trifida]
MTVVSLALQLLWKWNGGVLDIEVHCNGGRLRGSQGKYLERDRHKAEMQAGSAPAGIQRVWHLLEVPVASMKLSPPGVFLSWKCKEILTSGLVNPWRNQQCWHAHAQPIKLEVVRRRSDDPIGIRHAGNWRRHVIIEPAVLVISDQQCHFFPLWTGSQSFIHLLHKLLSNRHIMRGMIVVCREDINIEVSLFYHYIVRKLPLLSMALELEIVVMELDDMLEFPEGFEEESGGDILVIYAETEVIFVQRVEDCLLGESMDEIFPHIAGGSVRSSGVDVEPCPGSESTKTASSETKTFDDEGSEALTRLNSEPVNPSISGRDARSHPRTWSKDRFSITKITIVLMAPSISCFFFFLKEEDKAKEGDSRSIRVTEAGLGIRRILSADFTVEPEMLDAGDKLLLCPLALTELLLELVGVVSIENGFHELLTGA